MEKIINKDEILEGINIAALNFTERKSFVCFSHFLYVFCLFSVYKIINTII